MKKSTSKAKQYNILKIKTFGIMPTDKDNNTYVYSSNV